MTGNHHRRRGAKVTRLQHHHFNTVCVVVASTDTSQPQHHTGYMCAALIRPRLERGAIFMAKEWLLPQGLSLEMLDAYAREKTNERRREDYARNPERTEKHRRATYRNFFNKRGYLVLPMPPAQPWNELQERAILHAITAAMREQGGDQIENA